jgi:hypothetical protein
LLTDALAATICVVPPPVTVIEHPPVLDAFQPPLTLPLYSTHTGVVSVPYVGLNPMGVLPQLPEGVIMTTRAPAAQPMPTGAIDELLSVDASVIGGAEDDDDVVVV